MSTSALTRKLSKPHLALAMLVPVYPFITALIYIVMTLTEGWQIWQRTMLIAPLMVVSIIFFIAPMVQKHFARFIMRAT